MTRPKVTVKCVADQYADKARERMVEFIDPETGLGGLINFYRLDDGGLLVNVYNYDKGVTVRGQSE